LLATDPAPEVRIAAANCCDNLSVLAAAWENESDPAVRAALSAALRTLLSESPDSAGATALLGAAQCTDAMRADVARRAPDVERRRSAIAAIREEALLVELALTAEDAKTRMAAAQHVRTPDGLRKLADAAPLHRLQLVQERMDLERELDRFDAADDLTGLERDFVKVAKGYAERKGISYAAWRELGISADVLRKAGITRGS